VDSGAIKLKSYNVKASGWRLVDDTHTMTTYFMPAEGAGGFSPPDDMASTLFRPKRIHVGRRISVAADREDDVERDGAAELV
jgi:hypothetical protein